MVCKGVAIASNQRQEATPVSNPSLVPSKNSVGGSGTETANAKKNTRKKSDPTERTDEALEEGGQRTSGSATVKQPPVAIERAAEEVQKGRPKGTAAEESHHEKGEREAGAKQVRHPRPLKSIFLEMHLKSLFTDPSSSREVALPAESGPWSLFLLLAQIYHLIILPPPDVSHFGPDKLPPAVGRGMIQLCTCVYNAFLLQASEKLVKKTGLESLNMCRVQWS